MKLWEIVFEFHDIPNATIGMDGAANTTLPCTNDNAISSASHLE